MKAARATTSLGQQIMVAGSGEVPRAIEIAADEVARSCLIERAHVSGEHPAVADQVLHDRFPIGPINFAVETNRRNASVGDGRSRSPGVAGEVLISTSERTRSGNSSASNCANAPPAETPTTWAARIP